MSQTQPTRRINGDTMQPSSSSSRPHRNEIERNRRTRMNQLYSTLSSLVSSPTSEEKVTIPTLVDRATEYVKQRKENIEELKIRKEQLLLLKGGCENNSNSNRNHHEDERTSSMVPIISVRELGTSTTLEVNLIAGINYEFMVHEVFRVLHEEGAEVVSASYSTMGNKIFYTIHAQAILSRIGVNTSTVHQKLQKLVSELLHLASLTINLSPKAKKSKR